MEKIVAQINEIQRTPYLESKLTPNLPLSLVF